jgi:hypothetical protein
MNLKSKSTLLKTIITKIDNQLSSVPLMDHDGMPVEDSCELDNYISSITDLEITNGKGEIIHPFSLPLASALIYDEMEERKEQST